MVVVVRVCRQGAYERLPVSAKRIREDVPVLGGAQVVTRAQRRYAQSEQLRRASTAWQGLADSKLAFLSATFRESAGLPPPPRL